jgi:hypothetical protein
LGAQRAAAALAGQKPAAALLVRGFPLEPVLAALALQVTARVKLLG